MERKNLKGNPPLLRRERRFLLPQFFLKDEDLSFFCLFPLFFETETRVFASTPPPTLFCGEEEGGMSREWISR